MLPAQAAGKYFADILDTIKVLYNGSEQLWCGFLLASGMKSASEPEVDAQDTLAAKLAHLVLAFALCRFDRGLYTMVGWPYQLMRCFLGPGDSEATIANLKRDVAVFAKFQEAEAAGLAGADKWLKRSIMHLPAVIQVVGALRRRHCRPD